MPLQATSGAASYDAFGGGVPAVPNYIEDVFSTYLFTGTYPPAPTSLTIVNGIDLAGKGGLVWTKARNAAEAHILSNTATGVNNFLQSASDSENSVGTNWVTAFNSDGFTVGNNINYNIWNLASWTWRKQQKFFDIVTWTGSGANRTIAHNLGSVPGCIMVKRLDVAANWAVYHRSLANTQYLVLNDTAAAVTGATWWNSTTPTSSVFSVGTNATVNASGGTYIAYVFAHDAGGFGLTGTDNVISCGSYTTDGSGKATVTLGYEPQWILFKPTDNNTQDWRIVDSMRGFTVDGQDDARLNPNLSDAEGFNSIVFPTATGFGVNGLVDTTNWIYIAIRRGPMKVPTSGTSVFNALLNTGTDTAKKVTGTGFPVDLAFTKLRGANGIDIGVFDRLRGLRKVFSSATTAEGSSGDAITGFDTMDGMAIGVDGSFALTNRAPNTYVYECFRRAPSFFDEVCYTGTGVASRQITHNLAVVPELIICKPRSASSSGRWRVGTLFGTTNYSLLYLNETGGQIDEAYTAAYNYGAKPTANNFTTGTESAFYALNESGVTYVAYLFATCASVSKVFSYTGNGSSQTINCGFTGGARFVLIKRTDSTGDWYVWDTARGIVSGNDPHLSLNTTAAEVTTDDTIDTDSTGFVVNQVAATNVNVSSATYIGLAIA